MNKIKLSEILPKERNTFCLDQSMVALLLKQIDEEIEKKDNRKLGTTDIIERVKSFLELLTSERLSFNKDTVKKLGIPEHLFSYEFVGDYVAVYKFGVRRDSDEMYPIMQFVGFYAEPEPTWPDMEREKHNTKRLFCEINRMFNCLIAIFRMCFVFFNFVDDPEEGKQYKVSDVIDYECCLQGATFNLVELEYIKKHHPNCKI